MVTAPAPAPAAKAVTAMPPVTAMAMEPATAATQDRCRVASAAWVRPVNAWAAVAARPTTGTGGAGSAGQFPGESDAERAERLGRELEESVGGFDEVLSEEQREIATVGRNTEGFGGGGGSGGGAAGISLGEQAAGGTGSGSVAVANQPLPERESPVAGMSEEEIRERTPDDIPVTVDDDIIARQLREAALAEEDPVLRERLWEEYRKYNGI